ncbi:hypothetical protein ACFFK0_05410 [Paenibacillus chartarius]|uniref:Uncharacterized protein n=1 Tax=Paenibacillus chartarius TaxID=747481 RepID=A0ABV6DH11_9BACL
MKTNHLFIRINTTTRRDRQDALDAARNFFVSSGAWIVDYRMLSNNSICYQFEVEFRDVPSLHLYLAQTEFNVLEESQNQLHAIHALGQARNLNPDHIVRGTFQITFIHNDPDLVLDVPPFE